MSSRRMASAFFKTTATWAPCDTQPVADGSTTSPSGLPSPRDIAESTAGGGRPLHRSAPRKRAAPREAQQGSAPHDDGM